MFNALEIVGNGILFGYGMNYCQRFLPNLATLLTPLNKLLQKRYSMEVRNGTARGMADFKATVGGDFISIIKT